MRLPLVVLLIALSTAAAFSTAAARPGGAAALSKCRRAVIVANEKNPVVEAASKAAFAFVGVACLFGGQLEPYAEQFGVQEKAFLANMPQPPGSDKTKELKAKAERLKAARDADVNTNVFGVPEGEEGGIPKSVLLLPLVFFPIVSAPFRKADEDDSTA